MAGYNPKYYDKSIETFGLTEPFTRSSSTATCPCSAIFTPASSDASTETGLDDISDNVRETEPVSSDSGTDTGLNAIEPRSFNAGTDTGLDGLSDVANKTTLENEVDLLQARIDSIRTGLVDITERLMDEPTSPSRGQQTASRDTLDPAPHIPIFGRRLPGCRIGGVSFIVLLWGSVALTFCLMVIAAVPVSFVRGTPIMDGIGHSICLCLFLISLALAVPMFLLVGLGLSLLSLVAFAVY